jgi:hypothetical protein
MLVNKANRVLVVVCLLAALASSEMLQSPLRIRLNSDLLKGIFHKKDQEMLKIFENMKLGDHELSPSLKIKDLEVSLVPKTGSLDEFDYNLSLDMKTFIGVESDDLKLVGKGQIMHDDGKSEDFTIEGPIKDFRLRCEIMDEKKGVGKKVDIKEFEFTLDSDNTEIKSVSAAFSEHGHQVELKKWVQSKMYSKLTSLKDQILKGEIENLGKLPILSLIPVVSLYYATYGAE